jgi:Transposase IS4
MHVAIDRKPENGYDLQTAACSKSGVMLQIKIVKTSKEAATISKENDEDELHGTTIMKELVSPWSYSERIIVADSYFASVGAASRY